MHPLRRYTKNSLWYPILTMETFLPRFIRRSLVKVVAGISLVALFIFVSKLFVAYTGVDFLSNSWLDLFFSYVVSDKFRGLLCLLFGAGGVIISLESFYRSYYFDDISGRPSLIGTMFSFEVAWILHRAKTVDPLVAFWQSSYGEKVARRLGISFDEVKMFLDKRQKQGGSLVFPELPMDKTDDLTLVEFVELLYKADKSFSEWLSSLDITVADLIGATDWVVWKIELVDRQERWWSVENLSDVPSLGATWSYGNTFILDKYSRDLINDPAMHIDRFRLGSRQVEVGQISTILSRQAESNCLLVAEVGTVKMDIVYELVMRIKNGRIAQALESKRPVLFQASVFLADFKHKADFENGLIAMMDEVVKAGNVLLIIDSLPNFIVGAQALGVNLVAILDPYLSSTYVQVIGLCDTDAYHKIVDKEKNLLQRFEKVQAQTLAVPEIIKMLEVKLLAYEYKTGLRFTYGALKSVVELADMYLTEGELQDKSLDLLLEVMSAYSARVSQDISKSDIYSYVKTKTNIPIGDIGQDEKAKLLNLEQVLGARVVGQIEAVKTVSSAMRRSRAEMRNVKKPIGSFLFLGPTGVGKTETAKALANVFFGSDEAMHRLDMSEYGDGQAVERLIGSFTLDKPGVLSVMLRERPYGVLLLDEFEKGSKEVHNLFLQILDEGFFSDMTGKRVNARNLIIIATSNAGSDFIWDLVEKGEDLSVAKNKLIDHIVEAGIYKPELLNRFDAVVTFTPLADNELAQIAKLMLQKTAKRLSDQGIVLEVTDMLAGYVSKFGANRVFGARPMTRFIQDNIENLIAEKMIAGEIISGSNIKLVGDSNGKLSVVSI
jgi:ATP-dependent Clp protease ATP-binding subunit ClpC